MTTAIASTTLSHRKHSPTSAGMMPEGLSPVSIPEKDNVNNNKDHQRPVRSTVLWGCSATAVRAKWRRGSKSATAFLMACGALWILATMWQSSHARSLLPSPLLTVVVTQSTRQHAPRVISLYPNAASHVDHDLPMYNMLPQISHEVPALADEEFFAALADSRDYWHKKADPHETRQCKAQYEWQLRSFPSCNLLHERELQTSSVQDSLVLVANGYWRDVWVMPANAFDPHVVLKTIRYVHAYTERNYERHRRDAVAMERLTAHPYIVDIYAVCGNSGVFEYAGGGDIGDVLFPKDSSDDDDPKTKVQRRPSNITNLERLHIAVQAAMGLAAVHNSDKEGRPAIAHTDISIGQFVRVDGIFKLNDFNRARFLLTNTTDGSVCSYEIGHNPGKNRSPEEYLYLPETEKIDVYSLGNIFYMLLMDETPFKGISSKRAQEQVAKGERSRLYRDIYESTDPTVVALKKAMIMCHQQDPRVRATARQVEAYLKEQLEIIDPGRLATWPQAVIPS